MFYEKEIQVEGIHSLAFGPKLLQESNLGTLAKLGLGSVSFVLLCSNFSVQKDLVPSLSFACLFIDNC